MSLLRNKYTAVVLDHYESFRNAVGLFDSPDDGADYIRNWLDRHSEVEIIEDLLEDTVPYVECEDGDGELFTITVVPIMEHPVEVSLINE